MSNPAWHADVHGIWHYARIDGILKCLGAPVFKDGQMRYSDIKGDVTLPPGAWVCPTCREVVTHEVVNDIDSYRRKS